MPIVDRFRTPAAVLLLLAPLLTRAADWPWWLGPTHDGISTETNLATAWPAAGPPRLWEAQVGPGFSAVSVADGNACTMGFKEGADHVVCFDAATGKQLWDFTYPAQLAPKMFEGGPTATPVMHDGLVYTVSRLGELHCIDARTGRKVWSDDWRRSFSAKPPSWGYSGSPLVFKDWLVAEPGGPGACLVAYERRTGRIVWRSGHYAAGYASPIPFEHAGRIRFATFNAHGLCLWDADSGRELGALAWKTDYDVNAATPIIHQGRIFISSGYGTGCALVDATATPPSTLWQNKNMRNKHTNCVRLGDHLYGFDESDLACLRLQTGEIAWTQRRLGRGTLIAAADILILQTEKGEIVIARPNPDRFERIASARIFSDRCWVMPVLANGRLYCRSNKGALACLDLTKP